MIQSDLAAILPRAFSVLLGYVYGCFLTGELVARKYAGKPAAEVGPTGNPGMANIMDALGFKAGILVLIGDLLKVLVATAISYVLFHNTGWIVTLYAGLGCTVGHDFPFWRKFRGGKGVVTSCLAVVIFNFPLGLLANVIGMLVVFVTKYLCFGGVAIPLAFSVAMLCKGAWEAAILGGVLTLLALFCQWSSLRGVFKGTTKQNDVLGAILKKFRKK